MSNISLSSIPSLTRISGETYYSKFSQIKKTLLDFENDYGLDLDPDFQRGHVWTQENKIKFIEYILKGGKPPPLYFNSPIFKANNKHSELPNTLVLVDGKQRLNAILQFLDNKIPVFNGHYLDDFEDKVFLLRHFTISYAINNLQTRKDLLKWYLEVNEGHIAHSKYELERVYKLLDDCNEGE